MPAYVSFPFRDLGLTLRDPLPIAPVLLQSVTLIKSRNKSLSSSVTKVLDESRSFFRVHTGYFSNIPKCIKAEFIASWGCSQSSVVSSSRR
ncbi:hypothetical protein TNCV_1680631 [Trichonephila clavipes]|nr:hypothetical protein TNCV_1680631 [Trichonephila clavipes]